MSEEFKEDTKISPIEVQIQYCFCPTCGSKAIEEISKFCHKCGSRIQPNLCCLNCRLPYYKHDNYCRYCGKSIHQNGPELSFYKSITSLFNINRVSLAVSIIGLLIAFYQFDFFRIAIKQVTILEKSSDIHALKAFILFSILLTISIYNYRVPVIPDKLVLPGILVGLIMSVSLEGWFGIMESILGLFILVEDQSNSLA